MIFPVPTFEKKVALRLFSRRTALIACVFSILSITTAYSLGVSADSVRSLLASAFTGGAIRPGTVREIAPGSSLHESAEPRFFAAPVDATLGSGRSGHAATLLSDGKVLVTGGNSDGSSEVYDPAADVSASTGYLNAARSGHTASRLSDGRVLITGGTVGGSATASTEVYDPSNGTFSTGPSMGTERSGHTATVLSNGSVLIAGGGSDTAEIFDGTSFTAVAAAMVTSHTNASSVLMADGRVFIAGGNGSKTAEIFNPADGTFTATGNGMTLARARAHLRVLPDGKIQIIGGNNDGSMEIYDPAIDTIGAYAHVVPGTDTCASLPAGVKASQTRAALFYNGSPDPAFDRSGHTITEVAGNKAVVIGGTDNSGNPLNAATVFTSSPATITTDKLDYAPGETVTFSGTGFQAGETVRVVIHEDPHTHTERNFNAVADASGNFSGSYLVEEHDLNVHFVVAARGQTSGLAAQTTFTDANPQTITVGAPTSVTVIQGGTANFGNQKLIVGGNTNPCTVTFSVTPALPAGATPVWGANPVTTTGADVDTSFSVTTTGTTPTGTYNFQVIGTNGGGCQGPGPIASGTLTLIVNAATVNTTTAVNNATATYGDASVNLSATVSPASGPAINTGTVTFTVKQGANTIGSATTSGTISGGNASVNYLLPAGTNAGSYSIEATYNAGSGFNGSSDATPGTLTIGAKTLTASIIGNPTKTYDGNTNATLTSANFSLAGLVGSDNFTVTKTTGAYNFADVATATTVSTTLVAADFTPVGTTLASNYTLPTAASGSGSITKATPTVTVSFAASPITYDGAAHPASVTVNGVSGPLTIPADGTTAITYTKNAAPFAGTPTDAGSYTASATFTSANPNYDNASSSTPANLTINKANANCSVTGYNVTYDGNPHTATGSCTGVGGTSDVLAGLDLSGTTHTNAGSYPADSWTFTDATGNYNNTSGTVADNIDKANANCSSITGTTVTFDANPHGAAGSCKGVDGSDLTGLDLGATFTNVPGGTATWAFTDVTGNYNNATGTAAIVINKANAVCTITGYTGTFDASAHGASGSCAGVAGDSGASGSSLDLGASFTNVPGGTATWAFTGGTNYNDQGGTVSIVINKAVADCSSIGGYTGTFDAAAHGATGTCVGVAGDPGAAGSNLNLGASYTNVPGGTASWVFTGGTNYTDQNGSVSITINKAVANCTSIVGYTGTYDANPHGATGGCVGVAGDLAAAGSTLDLGASYTNVPGGTANWTFTGGTNYTDQSGNVSIVINKAIADCSSITGYTGTYDAAPHGATGGCTGVAGDPTAAGSSLSLGATFTNVPGGTATWAFTGGSNYTNQSGTVQIVINKADATCTITGYTGNFDAQSHGASGSCTGVDAGGAAVGGSLNLGSSFTNVPGGTANWTFTGGTNYNDQNGSVAIVINKAAAVCSSIVGFTGTYDAASHGATGSCVGVAGDLGAAGSSLNLGASYTNVPGGTANWSFTGGTNYTDQSGSVEIVINKANADCSTISGVTVTFDGNSHGATGSCKGVDGNDLAGLDLGASFTNVPGGTATWTFTDITGNYNDDTDTVEIVINKANATCTVNGVTVTYNGLAHGATGTCTGVGGASDVLAGLNLGASFTNVPGGTANWAFTDVTGNYNDQNGTASIVINKANAACTVTGVTVTYDGNPHGATGQCIGVGGPSDVLAGLNLGATFTNVPGGTANWAFTDVTGNYNNQSGTASIVINKATPTVSVTGGTYPYTGAPIPATGFAYGVGGIGDVLSPAVTFQYAGVLPTVYAATATPPTFVGTYQVTASFAGNSNYNSATNTANLTITTIYCFNGFLSPVGGSVESGNGGSFADPVRSFKLNSTIPFKFILYSFGNCSGTPVTTGIHRIQLAKYSNATDSDAAIDATPTDAATTGNQFRLTGTEWHYNLDTKRTPGISAGTWLVTATLQDGSTKTVWIAIKK